MLETDDMLTKWDSSKLVIYRIHNYQIRYADSYYSDQIEQAIKTLELYFHEIAPKLMQYHAKSGSKEKYDNIKRMFDNLRTTNAGNKLNTWLIVNKLHLEIQEAANLVGLHAGDKESSAGL